jgi:hypothetical protein
VGKVKGRTRSCREEPTNYVQKIFETLDLALVGLRSHCLTKESKITLAVARKSESTGVNPDKNSVFCKWQTATAILPMSATSRDRQNVHGRPLRSSIDVVLHSSDGQTFFPEMQIPCMDHI